ncbi:MAG: YHYH protein [Planctomycetota bacterium]
MERMITLVLLVLIVGSAHALPHHGNHHGDPTHESRPNSRVTMQIDGETRIIRSNGIPDHEPGDFPRQGNPNAVSVQSHEFRMPANPVARKEVTPMRGPIGVALNGVPFDPGTAEWWSSNGRTHDRSSGWNYEALSGHIDLGLDDHHAHVQPTGTYHYHGLPTGIIEASPHARGDALPAAMILIGYAADGFPIYAEYAHRDPMDASSPLTKMRSSYALKAGTRPDGATGPGGAYDGTFVQDWTYLKDTGDLDECNGRFGVTPEYPDGTYYYMATDAFPFLPRCFRGTPDRSFRHGGGGGASPPMRPSHRPTRRR